MAVRKSRSLLLPDASLIADALLQRQDDERAEYSQIDVATKPSQTRDPLDQSSLRRKGHEEVVLVLLKDVNGLVGDDFALGWTHDLDHGAIRPRNLMSSELRCVGEEDDPELL